MASPERERLHLVLNPAGEVPRAGIGADNRARCRPGFAEMLEELPHDRDVPLRGPAVSVEAVVEGEEAPEVPGAWRRSRHPQPGDLAAGVQFRQRHEAAGRVPEATRTAVPPLCCLSIRTRVVNSMTIVLSMRLLSRSSESGTVDAVIVMSVLRGGRF